MEQVEATHARWLSTWAFLFSRRVKLFWQMWHWWGVFSMAGLSIKAAGPAAWASGSFEW